MVLETFIAAFGGTAASLVALGFLFRSIISHRLTKDLESFRASLNLAALEHQIIFSRLHEKRADVIVELYSKLFLSIQAMNEFLKPELQTFDQEEMLKKVATNFDNLNFFYLERKIYFSETLCNKIEKLLLKMRELIYESTGPMSFSINHFDKKSLIERLQKNRETWIQLWDSFNAEVMVIKTDIEIEFRSMMGVTDSRKA